jgi:ribosomal protein S18 acetylase RimI-like enzyme
MKSSETGVMIRRAKKPDAAQIAVLSGQLGYPTTAKVMAARLARTLKDRNAACFVAETQERGIIGWTHVSVTSLLEVDRRAEVNGLIVDQRTRSRGAGWLLLQATEQWAKNMRCKGMSVRSNVLRGRAHAFYLAHGYEHYKTQKAFRKSL